MAIAIVYDNFRRIHIALASRSHAITWDSAATPSREVLYFVFEAFSRHGLGFYTPGVFFFSFQEISNETVTLYRGFLWVPVVPTGARGNSRAKPRKTVESVNDCHGFIWVPAFPVGVTRLSLGGPLYDILPVAQRTDSFTIKALVRWATGKRFTNRLPKLSLTTLSPPRTAGYSGLDRK